MHSRVFTYTALENGSPYCTVALGFLHLARRGVFVKTPREAWDRQNFELRQGVADWPLFCQTDKSGKDHTLTYQCTCLGEKNVIFIPTML